MKRKKSKYPERILGYYPKGTQERLRQLQDDDEHIADIVRAAMERELCYREKRKQ